MEMMDNIRRRKYSPETRKVVEQQNALSRRKHWDAGMTTKRKERYLHHPVPTGAREEIAEIDAELIRRTNRIRGGP